MGRSRASGPTSIRAISGDRSSRPLGRAKPRLGAIRHRMTAGWARGMVCDRVPPRSPQPELLQTAKVVLQRPGLDDPAITETVDRDLVDRLEAATRGRIAQPLTQVGPGAGEAPDNPVVLRDEVDLLHVDVGERGPEGCDPRRRLRGQRQRVELIDHCHPATVEHLLHQPPYDGLVLVRHARSSLWRCGGVRRRSATTMNTVRLQWHLKSRGGDGAVDDWRSRTPGRGTHVCPAQSPGRSTRPLRPPRSPSTVAAASTGAPLWRDPCRAPNKAPTVMSRT